MIDKHLPANTPDTLGATPHYVIQHHAVSRGAHGLSAAAQKLVTMAMSLIPPDLSSLTASFTFSEFCKAMGMPVGGEQYTIFKNAVQECMECVISVETEPDEKGRKDWKKFTWFTVSTFSEKTGRATMQFSDKLAVFLMALKWMYSKINLKDIGELRSRYAIKLFEMAMSYQSLKGKQGNGEHDWYFERSIQELRMILGVPEGAYPKTQLLQQNAIKKPLKEINEAGLGIKITMQGVKQGRRIVSIRFDCRNGQRTARGGKKTPLPLPEEDIKAGGEEQELRRYKDLYPKEFAELYEAKLAEAQPYIPECIKLIGAEGSALLELRRKYGSVK